MVYFKTNTMKLKQLFLLVAITSLAISCTKQDIILDKKETLSQVNAVASVAQTSTPETNNKAYIFVEPHTKYVMVANYLNTVTQTLNKTRFLGFFVGPGASVQHNLLYYIHLNDFHYLLITLRCQNNQ